MPTVETREKLDKSGLYALTKAYIRNGMYDDSSKADFAAAFCQHYSNASQIERLKVARLLADCRSAPKQVLQHLCCDISEVASVVLSVSPVLDEAELTKQILQGNIFHRLAIAQREDLSKVLVSLLRCFGEVEIVRALQQASRSKDAARHCVHENFARAQDARGEQTGQQSMTQHNGKLDQLVEAMESDWRDHYRPDEQIAPTPLAPDIKAESAAMEPAKPDLAEAAPRPFIDARYIDPEISRDNLVNSQQTLQSVPDNHLSHSFNIKANTPDLPQFEQAPTAPSAPPLFEEEALTPSEGELLAEAKLIETSGGLDELDGLEDMSDEDVERFLKEGAFDDFEEKAEAPGRRLSFRIGADDDDTAPIPSLEPDLDEGRTATIAFGGKAQEEHADASVGQSTEPVTQNEQSESPAMTIAWPTDEQLMESAARLAIEATLELDTPVDPAPQPASQAMDEASEILQRERALAAKARLAPVAESESGSDVRKADVDDSRSSNITLTIRKRDGAESEPKQQQATTPDLATARPTTTLPAAPDPIAAKASPSSIATAKEDWESALAHLSEEFVPANIQPDRASLEPSPAPIVTSEIEAPSLGTKPQAALLSDEQEPAGPRSFSISAIEPEREPETAIKAKPALTEARQKVEISSAAPSEKTRTTATQDQAKAPSTPLIHEHAPMGFMPDMISFEGLELVEAEPDLPSATDLLLQQAGRVPECELVEPVEVCFADGSLSSADQPDLHKDNSLMQQVSEQLALHKEAKSQTVTLTSDGDLTDLPELSEHKQVNVEHYLALRTAETGAKHEDEAPAATKPEWKPIAQAATAGQKNAIPASADAFYAYEDETRLALLQAMLTSSLADQALLAQPQPRLEEETANALVMARFGNDRIHLVEMLHDISGHKRMDLTRLLQDDGGEALIVYLYAIGLDESRALSLILHGPDAISHDYNKVAQLMTLFEQLYPAAASKIVDQLFGRAASNTTAPQLQSVHDAGLEGKSPRLRTSGLSDGHSASSTTQRPGFGRRAQDTGK